MDPVKTYWFHFPWTSTAGFHVSVKPPKLCGGINVDSVQPTGSTEASKPETALQNKTSQKHKHQTQAENKRRFKQNEWGSSFLTDVREAGCRTRNSFNGTKSPHLPQRTGERRPSLPEEDRGEAGFRLEGWEGGGGGRTFYFPNNFNVMWPSSSKSISNIQIHIYICFLILGRF